MRILHFLANQNASHQSARRTRKGRKALPMKPLFYHYSIFFSYMRIFYGKVCKKFLLVIETIS